jgi:transcriptional regulator GlxA family with amidase domain
VDGIEQTLALLFSETERVRCGHRLLADRLFEVLLLQVLRWLLDRPDHGGMTEGLIHGLAHPRMARALTAMHESPGAAWSLDSMAQAAGMSRSAFSAEFKLQLGVTPAEYLLRWRVSLAQSMLLTGSSIKLASERLGYASAASFSHAFTQSTGLSPRAWLQSHPA